MKKLLLGAAAAFAIAAPAHAATGYIGANYASTDSDALADNVSSWGVDGSVGFDASAGVGVALDASFSDSDETDSQTAGNAHIFAKSESNLFGGFVGAVSGDDSTTWDVGGEAAFFLPSTTLGVAVAYVNNDDDDTTAWGVNGSAKFFATDNFALGGNVGWLTLDDGGADGDAWVFGVNAEYQLDSAPISFRAGYNTIDGDGSDSVNTWSLGVRYNFGGTLKDRNHSGADLHETSGATNFLLGF